MLVDKVQLTRASYERLKQELEELTTRGRVEVARLIEQARALGDLSENGDYHAAKEAKSKIEARIRHLEDVLRRAEVVDECPGAGNVVPGARVKLLFEGDSEPSTYILASIEEVADDAIPVSPKSPLGQAILGKQPGEEVVYEAPSGPVRVKIVEVGASGGQP
jgi:transcription elongation factor GreA